MVTRKRRLEIGFLILGLILILGALNFKTLIGFFWHLTHSSKVQYGNTQIHVAKGWFPWKRGGYIILYNYPGTKRNPIILLDRDPMDLKQHSPKERVERTGRIFDTAERTLLDGIESVRITSHSLEGPKPYLILVIVPSKNLTITYQGTKGDIKVFDSFLKGVTFISDSS